MSTMRTVTIKRKLDGYVVDVDGQYHTWVETHQDALLLRADIEAIDAQDAMSIPPDMWELER